MVDQVEDKKDTEAVGNRINRGNVCALDPTPFQADFLYRCSAACFYVWNELLTLYLKKKGFYRKRNEDEPDTDPSELEGFTKSEFTMGSFLTKFRATALAKKEMGEEMSFGESSLALVGRTAVELVPNRLAQAIDAFEKVYYTKKEKRAPRKKPVTPPHYKSVHRDPLSFSIRGEEKGFKLVVTDWKHGRGWLYIPNSDPNISRKNPDTGLRYVPSRKYRIPVMGVRDYRERNGKITGATFYFGTHNKWCCSLNWEIDKSAPLPKNDRFCGIDVGLKRRVVISNTGDEVPLDSKEEKRLLDKNKKDRELVRELTKKMSHQHGPFKGDAEKGIPRQVASKSYLRTKIKKAKIQRRITKRSDALDYSQISSLVKNHGGIAVESLNVKSMIRKGGNRKKPLNRSLGERRLGGFLKKLKTKCDEAGRVCIEVDRWFPSSQLCYSCRYKNTITKGLSGLRVRTVKCEGCGVVYDRDQNAANNIKREGERIHREQDNEDN